MFASTNKDMAVKFLIIINAFKESNYYSYTRNHNSIVFYKSVVYYKTDYKAELYLIAIYIIKFSLESATSIIL